MSRRTIAQFIDRLADPSAPREDRAKIFRHLGKLEVAQGRNIDTLQSAYRIGARVAWRRIAEFGQSVNLPTVTICQLAEAVFDYVDEISVPVARRLRGQRKPRSRARWNADADACWNSCCRKPLSPPQISRNSPPPRAGPFPSTSSPSRWNAAKAIPTSRRSMTAFSRISTPPSHVC
ncbi:hypothetical protein [Kibdelosporangium philippinense]|uniref:hypothetical protein n=1 Tax=Kibdelosporangium philippinense TaxID=211113 RepID=UPI0036098ECA